MGKTLSEFAKDFLARRPHAILSAMAIPMLVMAVNPWSYAYYQLLQWVTCFAALIVIYVAWRQKAFWAISLFALIAVLFNPLHPVHLSRDIWRLIDVIAAAIFGLGMFLIQDTSQAQSGAGAGPRGRLSGLGKVRRIILFCFLLLALWFCLVPPWQVIHNGRALRADHTRRLYRSRSRRRPSRPARLVRAQRSDKTWQKAGHYPLWSHPEHECRVDFGRLGLLLGSIFILCGVLVLTSPLPQNHKESSDNSGKDETPRGEHKSQDSHCPPA